MPPPKIEPHLRKTVLLEAWAALIAADNVFFADAADEPELLSFPITESTKTPASEGSASRLPMGTEMMISLPQRVPLL